MNTSFVVTIRDKNPVRFDSVTPMKKSPEDTVVILSPPVYPCSFFLDRYRPENDIESLKSCQTAVCRSQSDIRRYKYDLTKLAVRRALLCAPSLASTYLYRGRHRKFIF